MRYACPHSWRTQPPPATLQPTSIRMCRAQTGRSNASKNSQSAITNVSSPPAPAPSNNASVLGQTPGDANVAPNASSSPTSPEPPAPSQHNPTQTIDIREDEAITPTSSASMSPPEPTYSYDNVRPQYISWDAGHTGRVSISLEAKPAPSGSSELDAAAIDELTRGTSDLYDVIEPQLPDVGVLFLATAVGVSTGAGVVLFNDVIHSVQDDLVWTDVPRVAAFGSFFMSRDPIVALWPYLLIPPIVGGFAVSCIRELAGGFEGDPRSVKVLQSAPDSARTGWLGELWTEKHKEAARPYLKYLAAALTLGSGASLGPEGPSVEMGKANASAFAAAAKKRERRITTDLLAAGAGAGVAAGFGAPMAGVVFAVETMLLSRATDAPPSPWVGKGNLTSDDGGLLITTVLIACVIASVITSSGFGIEAALRVPEYETLDLYQLPLFIVLGLFCGVTSSMILSLCRSSERSLLRLRLAGIPAPCMPMIGGFACGSLALLYPEVTYQGFDNINALLRLSIGPEALYTASVLTKLVIVKGVATAICRASGLIGGLYAPALFTGAAIGSAFCMVCQHVIDLDVIWLGGAVTAGKVNLLADSSGYALVGSAAMLAALCKVPLTSVFLLFELTHDYTIALPTLATVGIARWASTAVDRKIKPSLFNR